MPDEATVTLSEAFLERTVRRLAGQYLVSRSRSLGGIGATVFETMTIDILPGMHLLVALPGLVQVHVTMSATSDAIRLEAHSFEFAGFPLPLKGVLTSFLKLVEERINEPLSRFLVAMDLAVTETESTNTDIILHLNPRRPA
ncbi:MAG: hypothetical protein U0768_10095 [Anaerolineae bacterium]